jgi:hypothetical protein
LRFREIEGGLEVDGALAPEQALRKLVGASFDFHAAHPEFVRMVMGENINQASTSARFPNCARLTIPRFRCWSRCAGKASSRRVSR